MSQEDEQLKRIQKWLDLNRGKGFGKSTNIPEASSSQTNYVGGNNPINFSSDNGLDDKIDAYIQASVSTAAAKVNALFNEKIAFLQQSEKKVSQMLDKSEALMETITSSLNSVAELTDNSVKIQAELQEEVKYIKGNAISALSIFVSFFAFITVAINVFSKAESVVSASVLVLIFWCLLIGFNILISVQFKVFSNIKIIFFALAFVISISVLSIFGMFYFSPELQGVRYVFKFSV